MKNAYKSQVNLELWHFKNFSEFLLTNSFMEVVYTEPGIKGDTASTNSLKPATVNTGATIKVPLFINTGDKIRVDTRTREYYERIK